MTHWSIFTPPMNKVLTPRLRSTASVSVSQKALNRCLTICTSRSPGLISSTTCAPQLPNLMTSERVPGTGWASPGSSPFGLWACRNEGLMFSKSLRTPQLTQITGMPCSRNALISFCSGLIGLRFGEISMPRLCSQPPSVQKSFCMSTISNADLAASTTMFCGSALIDIGRGAGAGRVISTVSRVTSHDCPGLAPISTGGVGFAVTFMADLPRSRRTQPTFLLRRAGDALDQIIHSLDLLHRKLLAGRHHHRTILFGDRTVPDRLFAGDDSGLELEDFLAHVFGHGGAERVQHNVAAGKVAA